MGLAASQSAGLLIRSWHFQRRQTCINLCQFLFSPLLLIVFAVLVKVFVEETPDDAFGPPPDVPRALQNVTGGFAPAHVGPRLCTFDDIPVLSELSGLPGVCPQPPIRSPSFLLSVLDDTDDAGAVGSVAYETCGAPTLGALRGACERVAAGAAAPAANSSGLLRGWSAGPLVYPGGVGLGRPSFQPPGWDPSPVEQAAVNATRGGWVDTLYGTRSRGYTDRQAFYRSLYRAPRGVADAPRVAAALAVDRYVGGGGGGGAAAGGPIGLRATIFFNRSATADVPCSSECPLVAGVAAVTNAVLRDAVDPAASAAVYLRLFPDVPSDYAGEDGAGFLSILLSVALVLLYHLLLPSFLRMLVAERASGLRQMMQAHGLLSRTYWFATYAACYVQYLIAASVLTGIGYGASIALYVDTSPVAFGVLFFLWGHVMVALAFFLAPFFSNPETAMVTGWGIIIVSTLMGGALHIQLAFSDTNAIALLNGLSVVPSLAFLRAVVHAGILSNVGVGVPTFKSTYGTASYGMCSGDGPFCTVFLYFGVQWVVLMALGYYLDHVLPAEGAVPLHPLFFLGIYRGAGWRFLPHQVRRDAAAAAAAVAAAKAATSPLPDGAPGAEGVGDAIPTAPPPADHVAAEAARAAALGAGSGGIVLHHLVKVYPGRPPLRAVDGLSLAVPPDSVFGLLGANGAGKTSLLSVLTGVSKPSGGEVFMDGTNLDADVKGIRRQLGVCPQHDVLWGALTGAEHLALYARIKGVRDVKGAVAAALESLELTDVGGRSVSTYSGGMKRRLSVAIAFMGNPSIVLLDEPSSGLDPRSRYRLWDCIQSQRAGKTIILTTHSMEECSRLCGRVGIMSAGRLVAVGAPSGLVLDLSTGYRLTASLPAARVEALGAVVRGELAADAVLLPDSLGGSVTFSLPRSVHLGRVFDVMEASRERLGVDDWGVSQSTLEDVFISIVERDEAARRCADLEA